MKRQFNDAAAVHGYHIHIYYRYASSKALQPRELANEIQARFPEYITGSWHLNAMVGPHLFPNQAVHIKPEGFAKIIPWLQMNSEGLSVLIHPETGDEVKDHKEWAMWLGRPLEYNEEFFEQFKNPGPQGPQPG